MVARQEGFRDMGKMVEGNWEIQASIYEMNESRG